MFTLSHVFALEYNTHTHTYNYTHVHTFFSLALGAQHAETTLLKGLC